MTSLNEIARNWMPPIFVRWIRQIRESTGIQFKGDYSTWESASSHCDGYNAEVILAKVLAATIKVEQGEAAFERDSVIFDEIEYAWSVLAGLMWAAASKGGRLNVLDFGGALGSSYFQNRKFLRDLVDVRWNVVEQDHFVEAGRAHIQDNRLRFYKTIAECLSETRPNVVLLSSVLQYLKSPQEVIIKLIASSVTHLIIDRTPFSQDASDKILIQHVPSSIYPASYPMWVFSHSKFMKTLEKNWDLIAYTPSPEGYCKSSSGFKFSFQGMILEKRQ